jgi:hypothetical protein
MSKPDQKVDEYLGAPISGASLRGKQTKYGHAPPQICSQRMTAMF